MVKGIVAQRDEAVLGQLADIKGAIAEMKAAIADVAEDLGTVRLNEMADIRNKLAALEIGLRDRIATVDSTLAVLQYQARRSGAAAGAWISAVISVIVAAGAALLFRHPL
jgi:hypothetical protein